MTDYICSACKEPVSSEGTEALDHMINRHGVDSEKEPQADSPYLIPVESNPTALTGDNLSEG